MKHSGTRHCEYANDTERHRAANIRWPLLASHAHTTTTSLQYNNDTTSHAARRRSSRAITAHRSGAPRRTLAASSVLLCVQAAIEVDRRRGADPIRSDAADAASAAHTSRRAAERLPAPPAVLGELVVVPAR